MDDMRTHKLDPHTLTVNVAATVVLENGDHGRLTRNLSDELAKMLTERLNSTVGITHLRTDMFSVTIEEAK